MSVWKETKTPDGRVYYWNTQTKDTSWEKPADFSAGPDPTTIDAQWKEAKAPDGRSYYYNSITRETVWEAPEAYLKSRQHNNVRPSAPAFVAGGGRGDDGYNDRRMERRDDRTRDHHLPQKPSFDGGRGSGAPWEGKFDRDNTGFRGALAKSDEPEFQTLEQAEEAFFKVLKKHGITPDTSWEETLRTVIRDRDFRALKDPRERKQAFEKYCEEAREQEKIKDKERKERVREDFRKMLSTHDEIKHYTRWSSARPMLEREAVFKSAVDDDLRKRLFKEYRKELRKKHAEDEASQRSLAVIELKALLQILFTDPNTSWSEAEKTIANDERFAQNPIFSALDNIDVLTAFDTHIKELDRIVNDARQKEKHGRNRRERQARDAFRMIITRAKADGKIKAGSKWKDLYPLVHDEQSYGVLLGSSGSSPLDLFWDAVEDEESKLRSKRNTAYDILEEVKFEMTAETSLEEFTAVMRSREKGNFEGDEMRMIFERLLEKVTSRMKERERRKKDQSEQANKRAIDDLRSAIKHLDPPIRPGDKYETVLPKLQQLREYRALEGDENSRREAFEKHVDRLRRREEDRDRDHRNGTSRRAEDRDRDRRHRTRTPEVDAYEADRRKAQEARERQHRKASFGLTPPPRDRRDDRERDRYPDRRSTERRDHDVMSVYDRERRERELERERNYISRADPRDKGRSLDYGDEEPGSGSRPGSVRKRRDSDVSTGSRRDTKRTRHGRTRTPEPLGQPADEAPALQSGSEEGEIEEV